MIKKIQNKALQEKINSKMPLSSFYVAYLLLGMGLDHKCGL